MQREVAGNNGNTSSKNTANENWFQLPSIFLTNIQALHELKHEKDEWYYYAKYYTFLRQDTEQALVVTAMKINMFLA